MVRGGRGRKGPAVAPNANRRPHGAQPVMVSRSRRYGRSSGSNRSIWADLSHSVGWAGLAPREDNVFFDPLYLILIVATVVISGAAQMYIRSTFGRWSRVPNAPRLTGAQVVE